MQRGTTCRWVGLHAQPTAHAVPEHEVRFVIKMAAELLAKANTLSEPQQRRVAAILGALVADAAGTF